MLKPAPTRDSHKDKRYYDAQTRLNQRSLEKFKALIADPSIELEHQYRLLHAVFRRELEQLISHYSRGDTVEDLRGAFPRVVAAMSAYRKSAGRSALELSHFDAYVLALWVVSLAILLEVDEQEFFRVVAEIDSSARDIIYDRLVTLRAPSSEPAATLIHPAPYLRLLLALDASGAEQSRLIREFLDHWYDEMAPAYWHGSHLGDDAGYFGYWCFEVAAFAKGLAIDDSAFADQMYYPRDLAHYSQGGNDGD